MKITFSGYIADGSEIEDGGKATIKPLEGKHAGHTISISSDKHNCGAYQIDAKCSCGATYHNGMNGCWQNGHQRSEEGDQELSIAFDMAYSLS